MLQAANVVFSTSVSHILEMTRGKAINKTINESIKKLNEDNKKSIERTINETNNYSTK